MAFSSEMKSPTEFPAFSDRLEQLIRDTGVFIAQEFHRFSYDQVEYKAENDPFTFVDVQAEERLRTGCEALLPGSGFINEEAADRPSQNGYFWIIDPIDGTSNFTHGVPHFCISLALAYQGEVQLGYIYEPIHQDLFRAEKGKGASLNGASIRVSEKTEIGTGLVGTGFPYANHPWRQTYLEIVMEIMDQAHGLRRMGSAALDLAYVACGRYEAFFEYDLKPWDVAAGSLLVQEAGGSISDFGGGDNFLHGRQIVASNGKVHPAILTTIGRHPFDFESSGQL